MIVRFPSKEKSQPTRHKFTEELVNSLKLFYENSLGSMQGTILKIISNIISSQVPDPQNVVRHHLESIFEPEVVEVSIFHSLQSKFFEETEKARSSRFLQFPLCRWFAK